MNKRIDFIQNGGLHIYQDTLDFMQQSYRDAIAAIATAFGNKVIVSGMIDRGYTVDKGWVVIDEELMPFAGGVKNTCIVVTEPSGMEMFEKDGQKPVYYTKQASFGVNNGYLYTDFVRVDTVAALTNNLKQTTNALSDLKNVVDEIKPSTVPTGTIVMWSGSIVAIPAGWALCDGTSGQPDLRGKFVVGYSDYDSDYNGIGNKGGEKIHTLTINEMPRHNHAPGNNAIQAATGLGNNGNNAVTYKSDGTIFSGNSAFTADNYTAYTGGNQPHENRPPYFTLAYIIKL